MPTLTIVDALGIEGKSVAIPGLTFPFTLDSTRVVADAHGINVTVPKRTTADNQRLSSLFEAQRSIGERLTPFTFSVRLVDNDAHIGRCSINQPRYISSSDPDNCWRFVGMITRE